MNENEKDQGRGTIYRARYGLNEEMTQRERDK